MATAEVAEVVERELQSIRAEIQILEATRRALLGIPDEAPKQTRRPPARRKPSGKTRSWKDIRAAAAKRGDLPKPTQRRSRSTNGQTQASGDPTSFGAAVERVATRTRARGARQVEALDLIQKTPGITTTGITKALGIDRGQSAGIIRRLEALGKIHGSHRTGWTVMGAGE